MYSVSDLIGCIECDLLIEQPKLLAVGQRVLCPRCNHLLLRGRPCSIDDVAALSLTGLVLMLLSVFFPFLVFESAGQSNSISLWSSTIWLYSRGFTFLAGTVFLFVILIPATFLLALVTLTVAKKLHIDFPAAVPLARLASRISHWAMVEVFIIGVLIALIKVIAMADIVFGLSFWAYLGYTAVFIKVYSLVDSQTLWALVKRGK